MKILTGIEYICTLPPIMQIRLKEEIEKIPDADVNVAMSGRLTDLEDNIPWRKILHPYMNVN